MAGWNEGWEQVQLMGRTLLHPYFALHLVSLSSYFVLRFFALPSVSPVSQSTFLRWEIQAGLSLVLVLVVKFVRSNTLEGFIGDALLYSKWVVALLVAILDPRMLAWYLFTFGVSFLLWSQPTHYGSENVKSLTPLQLESYLLENRASAWLDNVKMSIHQGSVIVKKELYSTSTLQFGRVDVGRFPNVATKYGIEFGVYRRQLPTLVLFENGVEVSRLPQLSYDGMILAPTFTKSMVVQKLELDLLLIRSLSRKAGSMRVENVGK